MASLTGLMRAKLLELEQRRIDAVDADERRNIETALYVMTEFVDALESQHLEKRIVPLDKLPKS